MKKCSIVYNGTICNSNAICLLDGRIPVCSPHCTEYFREGKDIKLEPKK